MTQRRRRHSAPPCTVTDCHYGIVELSERCEDQEHGCISCCIVDHFGTIGDENGTLATCCDIYIIVARALNSVSFPVRKIGKEYEIDHCDK